MVRNESEERIESGNFTGGFFWLWNRATFCQINPSKIPFGSPCKDSFGGSPVLAPRVAIPFGGVDEPSSPHRPVGFFF